ncbi:hypothetical protein [Salinarchaeum laminariae]|uniref:hypothetical protein n=1 Tax=Salinarchaeum laminariae TaxID=869888 RepID=UPI0020BF5A35|nr:hypothetical protein [Salinarchaeum laminariae]
MHAHNARQESRRPRRRGTAQKLALAVGFLALAVGIAAAYRSPTTGYEQSIYRATPFAYWAAIGVATLIGGWVAVTASRRRRDAAHLLVAIAVISVLALPAIRGYYFYGAGDSLTHLGWAKEMDRGSWGPLQSLYPGVHLGGIIFGHVAGVELRRALVVLPLTVFPLAFVTFVSLTVSVVSDRPWAATIGLLSGLLFVPINGLTIHPMAHPSSQAIMLVPFVIYLMIRYLTAEVAARSLFSASSVAFGFAAVALVFYHPQETMDLVAMLLAIALVQYCYRRWNPTHPIASHHSIRAHTLVVGLAFLVWTFRHPRARGRTEYVISGLLGEGPQTVQQAGTWSSSLQAVGGSVELLFLKLFAVTVVFGVIAGLLALRTFRSGTSPTTRDALVTYLVAGLIPPGLLMAFVFVADQGDHYFRFLGFLAVPITILGAVAIAESVESLGVRSSGRTVAIALCTLFAVMLVVQAAGFHQSPYMYKSNQQVTDGSIEGYETTFDYRQGDTVVLGIRGGPRRYVDAIYGTHAADRSASLSATGGVRGPVFNANLTTAYESDRYLTIDDGDYQREVDLYKGLRYSEAGFERLERDAAISRVISNGDLEVYRVAGTES